MVHEGLEGALARPNGITKYSKWQKWVLTAVFVDVRWVYSYLMVARFKVNFGEIFRALEFI